MFQYFCPSFQLIVIYISLWDNWLKASAHLPGKAGHWEKKERSDEDKCMGPSLFLTLANFQVGVWGASRSWLPWRVKVKEYRDELMGEGTEQGLWLWDSLTDLHPDKVSQAPPNYIVITYLKVYVYRQTERLAGIFVPSVPFLETRCHEHLLIMFVERAKAEVHNNHRLGTHS